MEMKHIKTFENFLNEEKLFEGMTFDEIKDKYLENPYGIGANTVEYVEGANGNPAMLIFRHDQRSRRDQIESKLKSIGVPAKKLSKATADRAYKDRYELTMYESVVNEAYRNVPGDVKISGQYEITVGSKMETTRVAGFERQNDDSDSLYFMDEDPLRDTLGSLIVKNSDMFKLERGTVVKATTTKDNQEVTIKRVGDL
jgi:hypothetical protein